MLDAEIHTLVDEERRVLSLPGFLSYRANLPLDKVSLETLRLPPLNQGGRYAFTVSDNGAFLAVRLDLNPARNVAGHVRIAISSVTRPPIRLVAAEQRLERQVIDEQLIKAAIAAARADLPTPLTQIEQAELVEVLKGALNIEVSHRKPVIRLLRSHAARRSPPVPDGQGCRRGPGGSPRHGPGRPADPPRACGPRAR